MECKGPVGGIRTCTVGKRTFKLNPKKTNKTAKARRMKALRRNLSCKQSKSTGRWDCELKRIKS